jgi:hypothetical protein
MYATYSLHQVLVVSSRRLVVPGISDGLSTKSPREKEEFRGVSSYGLWCFPTPTRQVEEN